MLLLPMRRILGRRLDRVKIPLGELGRYPMGIFPAAFTFDHHTHLRHDVAGALGKTPPPIDAARMAVAMEWMIAGIPQMCREAMRTIERPVDLTLNGPGGGTWGLSPSPAGLLQRDCPPFAGVLQAGLDRLPDVDLVLQILPGGVFGQPLHEPPGFVFDG